MYCMIVYTYSTSFVHHSFTHLFILLQAFQNFQRKLVSFIKYIRLTRNLESAVESATYEEITTAGDCLICRENMSNVVTGCRKLRGCNHIFHVDCLRMWLQHQQSCPLCRAEIVLTASVTTTTSVTQPVGGAGVGPNAPGGAAPTTEGTAVAGVTSSAHVEDVERDLLEYLQRDASDRPVEQTTPQPYRGTTTATAESTAPVMPTDTTLAPATTSTTTATSTVEAESTAALPTEEAAALRPLSPEYVKRVRQQYYQKAASPDSPLPPPDSENETSAVSNIENISPPAVDASKSYTSDSAEAAATVKHTIKPFPSTSPPTGTVPSLAYTISSSSSHQHTQQREAEGSEHILPNFFCVIKGTHIPPNPTSTSTGAGSEAVGIDTAVAEVVTVYKDSNITSDVVRTIKKVRIIPLPTFLYYCYFIIVFICAYKLYRAS